jgi:tetratricopeptide (TPR) repeat protein
VRLRDLVYAPSGLVAYHLKRGEDEQAEQLLVEQAGDDLGRLRLAAYWWTSGRIDEQIDAVRRRWEQTKDPGDARLLVYLHRADGDLDAAYRIAQGLGDPGLEKALLVEMRRWADAAAMQQSHSCPLPIPWTAAGPVPALHQQIEQQGLTAAYQRLAGDVAAFDKTMEQVVQTAAAQPDDTTLQWLCVEALLLNGRVDQGLKHLAGYDPGRAFDLLSVRHQYHDALRLLGWVDGKPLDADWIASLPTRSQGGPQQVIERVDTALKVVRLLHSLGRREDALAAFDLLEEYSRNQADDNSSGSPRKQCLERLSQTLLAWGQPQRAWELAAETILDPTSLPLIVARLYGLRSNDARLWWNVFRRANPNEAAAQTFARLHEVMEPRPGEDPDEFEAQVEQAIRWIEVGETFAAMPRTPTSRAPASRGICWTEPKKSCRTPIRSGSRSWPSRPISVGAAADGTKRRNGSSGCGKPTTTGWPICFWRANRCGGQGVRRNPSNDCNWSTGWRSTAARGSNWLAACWNALPPTRKWDSHRPISETPSPGDSRNLFTAAD